MARIPEESIDRIKQQTDLAALVRSRGIDLKKHGSKDLIGLCPFHDDHDPSFVVTPGKGLYHCLGCGAAGNAIQFVEKFDGISFRHAFELLAEGGPAAFSSATESPVKRATIPKLENPFDPKVSDAELMGLVVDYYHERLLKTPAALDYLRDRSLYNLAAISRFRLGFADRSLGLRLPEKSRAAGKAIRGRLEQLGIYRKVDMNTSTARWLFPYSTPPVPSPKCMAVRSRRSFAKEHRITCISPDPTVVSGTKRL